MVFFLLLLPASAKRVKITIDGTVSPTQTVLYLIVNEDTANARLLPIQDAHFSTTIKVDADAFIRLYDYKEWPERSNFVLIPDSKHVTVNMRTGEISGSKKSKQLQEAIYRVKRESSDGFHIDVFSDDPQAWREARLEAASIRKQMDMHQQEVLLETLRENDSNLIPAWLVYCYSSKFSFVDVYRQVNTSKKWAKQFHTEQEVGRRKVAEEGNIEKIEEVF